MSRLAWFDCAAGAAGDMILGALVDLGLPVSALEEELRRLPLRGYHLEARKVHRAGLHATKVDVVVEAGHGDHPHARGLRDILGLLDGSSLEPAVRERAGELFRRLAEAEAAVHGTPVEAVHFHEVGAVDSIVDVVGAVIGLRWLGAARIAASPLNVGTGTVSMSHGVFPVPPPATARLLQGVPAYGEGQGELLTPTGALLVTAYASSYGPLPPLRLQSVGNGAGSKDTPGRPNVLRLFVGDEDAPAPGADRVTVLECQVDDLPPQLAGALLDRLIEAGAVDAFLTPVQMKKGRPGLLFTVLCEPARREAFEELLFAESTTLGVRRYDAERAVLARRVETVETPYGPVGVKVGHRGARVLNAQPEYEDCLRAARAREVPVKEVWAAALSAWRAAQGRP